jgi:hypothetical protein
MTEMDDRGQKADDMASDRDRHSVKPLDRRAVEEVMIQWMLNAS